METGLLGVSSSRSPGQEARISVFIDRELVLSKEAPVCLHLCKSGPRKTDMQAAALHK